MSPTAAYKITKWLSLAGFQMRSEPVMSIPTAVRCVWRWGTPGTDVWRLPFSSCLFQFILGTASLATNATSILSVQAAELSVLPLFFSGPAGCLPIRGHPEAGRGELLLFQVAVTVEGQMDCKVWQLQIPWSKEAHSRVTETSASI